MENEGAKALITEKASTPDLDSAFIQKIIQKTSEKKITWERTDKGHSGRTIDGSLSIEITLQQVPIFGLGWRTFTVQRGGEDILRLVNGGDALFFLAGGSVSPVHRKVAELLRFLDESRLREVKEAMSDLDKL